MPALTRQHTMPFGTALNTNQSTQFRLYAPTASHVALVCTSQPHWQADLVPQANGWYMLSTDLITPGMTYQYCINHTLKVPDPAARFNPHGVHGPTELIDPQAFQWQDTHWQGRPWHEAVIYELHVGSFTAAGTFAAVIPHLKALASQGITAIELMPVAAFAGQHGWGYDGVLPFAPHAAYGRPENLKLLVQAAHACGLMVLLDVVYNHFGPDGNYLHCYANTFFTNRIHTPWGSAIEFEGAAGRVVRDFFIHNALYWLEEYHLDGLRIDAVHAMHDRSATHFIDELTTTVQQTVGRTRPVHLILENHENQSSRLQRDAQGRCLHATAQWNDDFHHALHVLLTGECDGYYVDFADHPLQHLGRTLTEGFAFQGETSQFAGQRLRGEPSKQLPPEAFVNFLQTHDQVGNRAFGERLAQLCSPAALHAGLAILLLAPHIPMLFMGEEYAADQPFLYFCDFHDELGHAVTAGRRQEFAQFAAFKDPAAQARIPDPCDLQTFTRSRLEWTEQQHAPHSEVSHWVHTLLQLRAHELMALLPHFTLAAAHFVVSDTHALQVTWPINNGNAWILQANLNAHCVELATHVTGRVIYHTHAAAADHRKQLSPWEVRWIKHDA